MKVYIVTSGEYSDYGINRVFTDKERAELYCAMHEGGCDPYFVEEWETDDVEISTTKPYYRRWEAKITPSGLLLWIGDACTFTEKNSIEKYRNYNGSWFYIVIATLDKDKTEDEAKKIIFDRLAAWKCENEVEGGTR